MKNSDIKHLNINGWKVGSSSDFLELSKEEIAIIDIKISLSKKFATIRRSSNLTQIQAAKTLHTSQSRIAKMEAGDPSVSIDLLIKGMISLGASKKTLASAFANS